MWKKYPTLNLKSNFVFYYPNLKWNLLGICGSSAQPEWARPIYSKAHAVPMKIKLELAFSTGHHIASVFVTASDSEIKHSRKEDLAWIQNILHLLTL